MLRRISLVVICFLSLLLSLSAEETAFTLKNGKKEQIVNVKTFNELSKETFEIKGKNEKFVSFNQMALYLKTKSAKSVEIKSSEGMKIAIKSKEFNQAGLIFVQEKKNAFFRVVIKGDTFRNRWLKNVVQVEFQ